MLEFKRVDFYYLPVFLMTLSVLAKVIFYDSLLKCPRMIFEYQGYTFDINGMINEKMLMELEHLNSESICGKRALNQCQSKSFYKLIINQLILW